MNAVVNTWLAVISSVLVVSCGATNPTLVPHSGSLLPNPTFQVTPTHAITFESLASAAVAGALVYYVYDPLAPNWTIEEKALTEDSFYLLLRAKSFRTGGDGEAIQVLKRRAVQLQHEKGFSGYRLIDYSEGVESSTPLTHRVSTGIIQLVKAQPTLLPSH